MESQEGMVELYLLLEQASLLCCSQTALLLYHTLSLSRMVDLFRLITVNLISSLMAANGITYMQQE